MIPIDELLREFLTQYRQHYSLPQSHNRTVTDILTCRTDKLGGQTWFCESCRKTVYTYHSCKNRMCPKCQNNQTTGWLNKQYKKLLPVKYFMVTFTIPAELRNLFRNNKNVCYNLLFKASCDSLRQLAADKRFIGGEIGLLGVLQTWASNLIYHPHIHYILPGIALSNSNSIKISKDKFPVHTKPLTKLFQGKLCAGLKENNFNVPSSLWNKNWVVDIQAVGDGKSSLKYLGKYIYRTAISNNNILSAKNGNVTIRIKDKQTRKTKTITLSAIEFLRRFLQHTLPKGFQRVRSFGLLHPKRKATLLLLQLILKANIHDDCVPKKQAFKCPDCGKEMTLIETSKRKRAPPLSYLIPQFTNIIDTKFHKSASTAGI